MQGYHFVWGVSSGVSLGVSLGAYCGASVSTLSRAYYSLRMSTIS